MSLFPAMPPLRRRPPQAISDTPPSAATKPVATADSSTPPRRCELSLYTSLMDLRKAVQELESLKNLTVVLALDDRFCGSLTALVARPSNHPAMRLVLAVGRGRLPGIETIGDLAAGGAALGWQEIVLETESTEAVRGALATLRTNERLVVFAPSWHDTATLVRLLS